MRHEGPPEQSVAPSPDPLGDDSTMPGQSAARPTTLMVLGRSPVLLQSIRPLLEAHGVEVVAETSDAAAVLNLAPDRRPDVILTDVNMDGAALSVIRKITSATPAVGVVVVAADPDDPRILSALAAGASACLAGDPSADELLAAVRAAAQGESVISPAVARQVVGHVREHSDGDLAASGLTSRELEVLRLLARGWDNARIGSALYVSRGTVKHHISSILTKLHVDNRIQAAVRAVRSGLMDE